MVEARTKINDCGLSEQLLCMHSHTCAITFCSKICVNCLRLDYNDRLTTKNTYSQTFLLLLQNDTQTLTTRTQHQQLRKFIGKIACVST